MYVIELMRPQALRHQIAHYLERPYLQAVYCVSDVATD